MLTIYPAVCALTMLAALADAACWAATTRLPDPAGKLVPGGQGIRVLGTEDPLQDGQQRGELGRPPMWIRHGWPRWS